MLRFHYFIIVFYHSPRVIASIRPFCAVSPHKNTTPIPGGTGVAERGDVYFSSGSQAGTGFCVSKMGL
jgi:hypothetical protein